MSRFKSINRLNNQLIHDIWLFAHDEVKTNLKGGKNCDDEQLNFFSWYHLAENLTTTSFPRVAFKFKYCSSDWIWWTLIFKIEVRLSKKNCSASRNQKLCKKEYCGRSFNYKCLLQEANNRHLSTKQPPTFFDELLFNESIGKVSKFRMELLQTDPFIQLMKVVTFLENWCLPTYISKEYPFIQLVKVVSFLENWYLPTYISKELSFLFQLWTLQNSIEPIYIPLQKKFETWGGVFFLFWKVLLRWRQKFKHPFINWFDLIWFDLIWFDWFKLHCFQNFEWKAQDHHNPFGCKQQEWRI